MNQGTVALPKTGSRSGYKLAAQILFLVFMGGLIAATRKYLDLSLGIPGHTGLLWMFLMVIGCGTVRRSGSGLAMGASTALWVQAFGTHDSLAYSLLLYSGVGLSMDVVIKAFHMDLAYPLAGLVAGAVGHGAKYLFIVAYATTYALPKHFLVVGIMTSLGYHVLFGVIGGLLGGMVLWMGGKNRFAKSLFDWLR